LAPAPSSVMCSVRAAWDDELLAILLCGKDLRRDGHSGAAHAEHSVSSRSWK
jgi:hypothetical protein